jgi:hypothetical protein
MNAQDNYEIQVYPSETVGAGTTMLELHSNYTIHGSDAGTDGVRPSQSALHETLELTHGFSAWSEIGFYLFTSANPGYGWQIAGSHIRPRLAAPEEWEWPVGASISLEFGYQRSEYSSSTTSLEVRPIVDHTFGNFYVSLNPTLDFTLAGTLGAQGAVFSPNAKIGYAFSEVVNAGIEYYGSLGQIGDFDPAAMQEQQIFPSADFNFSPEWEVNVGLGFGLTTATDPLIAKLILGRRFD